MTVFCMHLRWLALAAMAMAHANAQAPQKMPAVTAAQPMAPQTSVAGAAITEVSQPLSGRLFYSREQRERMDRARARGDAMPGTTDVAPTPSTLNGFVKRSDGQTMIWVDGQPRYNSTSRELENLRPQDVGGSSERIQLISQSTKPPVRTAFKQGFERSKKGKAHPARHVEKIVGGRLPVKP